jgi:hypothetical protein
LGQLIEKDALDAVEEDNIQPPPHYRPDGPPQIVTSDTARQGPSGWPMLLVLLAGLIAIGVAWIIVARFVH